MVRVAKDALALASVGAFVWMMIAAVHLAA